MQTDKLGHSFLNSLHYVVTKMGCQNKAFFLCDFTAHIAKMNSDMAAIMAFSKEGGTKLEYSHIYIDCGVLTVRSRLRARPVGSGSERADVDP